MKQLCDRDKVRGQLNFIICKYLFLNCFLLLEYVVEIVQLKMLLPFDFV